MVIWSCLTRSIIKLRSEIGYQVVDHDPVFWIRTRCLDGTPTKSIVQEDKVIPVEALVVGHTVLEVGDGPVEGADGHVAALKRVLVHGVGIKLKAKFDQLKYIKLSKSKLNQTHSSNDAN